MIRIKIKIAALAVLLGFSAAFCTASEVTSGEPEVHQKGAIRKIIDKVMPGGEDHEASTSTVSNTGKGCVLVYDPASLRHYGPKRGCTLRDSPRVNNRCTRNSYKVENTCPCNTNLMMEKQRCYKECDRRFK